MVRPEGSGPRGCGFESPRILDGCPQTMFKILRLKRQRCQIKRITGLPKTWGLERPENKNPGGGGTLATHG